MIDAHLILLCREYIEYVDAMRSGRPTVEEIQILDRMRQLAHDELCTYTGQARTVDMYSYARAVLHAARAGGSRA